MLTELNKIIADYDEACIDNNAQDDAPIDEVKEKNRARARATAKTKTLKRLRKLYVKAMLLGAAGLSDAQIKQRLKLSGSEFKKLLGYIVAISEGKKFYDI